MALTNAAGELRRTTLDAMRDNTPYLENIRGANFDKACALGRALSLDEAVEYALSNRS